MEQSLRMLCSPITTPFTAMPVQLVNLLVIEEVIDLLEDDLACAVAIAWLIMIESSLLAEAITTS